ncbi:GNAT family N-acetyltransferase [Haloarchaeobius sp. DT45]|uniref:GNAT family N-acetyltransferase n=1 Tax=Haloarchaeobius sp. DT45 TaxID=3446116 RepID=UPI003F6ABE00
MHVREATLADVPAVRGVHEAAIRELGRQTYSQEQVDAWAAGVASAEYADIDDEDCYFVVAERENDGRDDPVVVAFGSLWLTDPATDEQSVDAEVTAVYVHPAVARRGVGSQVLAALEREARARGVETLGLTASTNAVPFYEAHGYERVTERLHEFSSHLSTGVEGTVVVMDKSV